MIKFFGVVSLCALFVLGCSGGGENKADSGGGDENKKSKSSQPKERSEEEKKAIAAIEKLGGKVVYDQTSEDKTVFEINLADSEVKDADLVQLQVFAGLEFLNLMDTDVTDEGIQQLASITTLQEVRLAGSLVSVDGAKNLQNKLPDCHVSRDR